MTKQINNSKMKKIILVVALVMVGLTSCKKEEDLMCGKVLGGNYKQAAVEPETFRYIIFENSRTGKVDKIYAVDFEIPPYEDTVANKLVGMEWCLKKKEW